MPSGRGGHDPLVLVPRGAARRLNATVSPDRPSSASRPPRADARLRWPQGAGPRPEVGGAADIDDASHGLTGERALVRVERTYLLARAVVAVGLVLAHAALAGSGVTSSRLVWLVISLYTVQTLALRLWLLWEPRASSSSADLPPSRVSVWRIVSTMGVDFATFAVLHAQQSGANFNFAALLVLPVLMAGVLLPRRLALAAAAGVTLSLLLMAWHESLQPRGGAVLMQSGLAGVGLFVIAWIAGELAARLRREEQLALGSLALARRQSELNRLVIDEMGEGVLVLDRRLQLRALNPAARSLLGLDPQEDPTRLSLRDRSAWAALADLVEQAFAEGRVPEDGRELTLHQAARSRVQLRVRLRFTEDRDPAQAAAGAARARERWAAPGFLGFLRASPSSGRYPSRSPERAQEHLGRPAPPAYGVLLLEDGRAAHVRTQQEKLAAMGRMSAGIAHEIRNPLAAIAQANALLAEEPLAPAQQRLAGIVADNVRRLQRIVDDVLEVVPGPAEPVGPLEVVSLLTAVVEDWCRAHRVDPAALQVELPAEPLMVVFDPEHLRRVVVNLLDNAWTHGSGRPGSLALRLCEDESRYLRLSVSNDGAPVAPEALAHLFEPFFSTRSRGTGLGLYICRELCGRHGARIEHQAPASGEGATFVVTLQRDGAADRAAPVIAPPSRIRQIA